MSPKSIIIVLLAMSGSFITILAVLGYAVGSTGSGRGKARRSRAPQVAVVAPRSPVLTNPPLGSQTQRSDAARIVPDIPSGPQPLSEVPAILPPIPEKEPEIATLARVTERRLQGVEQALSRQVAELKKSRDEMLDELAGQLAAMSVGDAASTLAPLDDETAALTLHRLGAARRSAILRTLPVKRRTALERHLKNLPDR